MRAFFLVLLLCFGFLISGCAARAVQTEMLLAEKHNLPSTALIKDIPFIDQSEGYCGPATLTMAMQHAGRDVKIEEIAQQVFTPGLKGSLQSHMISAARRNELTAIPIKNLSALLTEISAGNSVIIFENLALSWLPQWHYALALGYDLQKQEIILHSGHEAYFRWDLAKFERSWMLGDYWGLVVLPAGKLSATANEIAHVTAALGLENANNFAAAEKSYRAVLEKWPTSLVGLIGLANLIYKKGQYKESVVLLKQAVVAHPSSEAAKHNLLVAQKKSD